MSIDTLPAQLRYVEDAHEALGLTYKQIAAAIGADESTLHRWRAGDSEPRAVFISRLEALKEFQTELLDTLYPDAARAWIRRSMPALDGRRPLDLLEQGRIEPLVRMLMQMNLGHST